MGDPTWWDRLKHKWWPQTRCRLTHHNRNVNCQSGWWCRHAQHQRDHERLANVMRRGHS